MPVLHLHFYHILSPVWKMVLLSSQFQWDLLFYQLLFFVIVVGLPVAFVVGISVELCDATDFRSFVSCKVPVGWVVQNVVGHWVLVVVDSAVVGEWCPHINWISDFKEKYIYLIVMRWFLSLSCLRIIVLGKYFWYCLHEFCNYRLTFLLYGFIAFFCRPINSYF